MRDQPAETGAIPERKGTSWQAARAVFWAFFGVRKQKHYEADVISLTLPQVIIAGLIGGLLFVLGLVALVTYITR